jgi:hypothetical protein
MKPETGFFRDFFGFLSVLCIFNQLGSLLFAQSANSMAAVDGVLIRL